MFRGDQVSVVFRHRDRPERIACLVASPGDCRTEPDLAVWRGRLDRFSKCCGDARDATLVMEFVFWDAFSWLASRFEDVVVSWNRFCCRTQLRLLASLAVRALGQAGLVSVDFVGFV